MSILHEYRQKVNSFFGKIPGRARIASSLRWQLVLIPSGIIFSGLALSLVLAILASRARIEDEADTSIRMGRILASAAIVNVIHVSDIKGALKRLSEDLPKVRHLHMNVFKEDGTLLLEDESQGGDDAVDVPDWFVQFLGVSVRSEYYPIINGGQLYGSIGIRSNPLDEIEEIWREVRFLTELLVGISVLIGALVLFSVHRALRPIHSLSDGFDRLERGDFDCAVPPIPVTELSKIGEQFNSLVQSLRAVTADNHLLIDKTISMQEAERKEIAQELHDEIGPALFGIRADMSWLVTRARAGDLSARDIEDRAQGTIEMADSLQRLNSRLLEKLRPLVLDELGLVEAMRQIVASWRSRYPDMTIDLDMPDEIPGIDEALALTLYRAAQECLTNIIRHANANTAFVSLTLVASPTGTAAVHFFVKDDGGQVQHPVKFGIGLLGMRERVHAAGGQLFVGPADETGTLVDILIPVKEKDNLA